MSNFYQKKAKKYKLKYLNLLNQFGGCEQLTKEQANTLRIEKKWSYRNEYGRL
jgi:hypothetical protein